jgi:hypothetical protein
MKKINSIKLMLTFAGCFLGAGYVSGQELWQFFGSFGKIGFLGIAVAAVLLSSFGIILTRYVQLTGISDMDKVVIKKDNKIFDFTELKEQMSYIINSNTSKINRKRCGEKSENQIQWRALTELSKGITKNIFKNKRVCMY